MKCEWRFYLQALCAGETFNPSDMVNFERGEPVSFRIVNTYLLAYKSFIRSTTGSATIPLESGKRSLPG